MRNIAALIAIPMQFTGLTPLFSEQRAPNDRSERRSKSGQRYSRTRCDVAAHDAAYSFAPVPVLALSA